MRLTLALAVLVSLVAFAVASDDVRAQGIPGNLECGGAIGPGCSAIGPQRSAVSCPPTSLASDAAYFFWAQDPAGNCSIPANGAALATMANVGDGTLANATQATSDNQPAYETNVLNSKGAVSFDGSNDYVTLVDSKDWTSAPWRDATWEMVIVFRKDTAPDRYIMSNNPTGAAVCGMGITFPNLNPRLALSNGTGWIMVDTYTTITYTQGAWSLFGVYGDDTRHRATDDLTTYENSGVDLNDGAACTPTEDISIGADGTTPVTFFDGTVALFAIWDHNLTSQERSDLADWIDSVWNLGLP